MGYSIIGFNKIKSLQQLNAVEAHNERTMAVDNADSERTADNIRLVPLKDGLSLVDTAKEHLRIAGYDTDGGPHVRSNAVYAIEVEMTFSRESLGTFDVGSWQEDSMQWLRKTFNADPLKFGNNIIHAVCHMDETTPHIHAIIIPIDDKGHLNCKYYLDGPASIAKYQTMYADEVGKKYGLQRGQEYSIAKNKKLKSFYSAIDAQAEFAVPDFHPEESIVGYKERVEKVFDDAKMNYQKKISDEKQKGQKAVSEEIVKRHQIEKESEEKITALKKELHPYHELVREFGPLEEIKKKLVNIESQETYFREVDDPDKEIMRERLNLIVKKGYKQRKRNKNKEQHKTK